MARIVFITLMLVGMAGCLGKPEEGPAFGAVTWSDVLMQDGAQYKVTFQPHGLWENEGHPPGPHGVGSPRVEVSRLGDDPLTAKDIDLARMIALHKCIKNPGWRRDRVFGPGEKIKDDGTIVFMEVCP